MQVRDLLRSENAQTRVSAAYALGLIAEATQLSTSGSQGTATESSQLDAAVQQAFESFSGDQLQALSGPLHHAAEVCALHSARTMTARNLPGLTSATCAGRVFFGSLHREMHRSSVLSAQWSDFVGNCGCRCILMLDTLQEE